MQNLVLLQVFCCFFLTGLIWTIQLVHYPSFFWVQRERFNEFSVFHSRRVSFIVIPVMVLELVTAGLLLLTPTPLLASKSQILMNVVGVALIWLSTFLLSVPCHSRLSLGFCKKTVQRLVATNWPRTFIWSLRSFLWFSIIGDALIV